MLVKRFLPGVYGLSAESKTKHCIEAALFGRLDQMLRVTESRRNKKHLIKAVLLGRLHQMLRTQFAKFVSILFFAFLQMYSLWMISLTAFQFGFLFPTFAGHLAISILYPPWRFRRNFWADEKISARAKTSKNFREKFEQVGPGSVFERKTK